MSSCTHSHPQNDLCEDLKDGGDLECGACKDERESEMQLEQTESAEQAYSEQEGDQEGEQCTVCLEPLIRGQLVTYLYCNHVFHTDCLHRWLETKFRNRQFGCCPNCNLRVVAAPPEPEKTEEENVQISIRPTTSEPVPVITASAMCGTEIRYTKRNFLIMAFLWVLILAIVALAWC